MSRLYRISITLLTAAAAAGSGRPAQAAAQDAAPAPQAVQAAGAALEACAAADGSAAEKKQAADDAETRHRALLRQQPQNPELRVGLA
jgi:hypothetical protein